jgi:hypothetical protein
MFCGKCGSQVEDGNAFCTRCGAPLNASAAPAQYPYPQQSPVYPVARPKKKSKGLIIAIVACVLVAALIPGVLLLSPVAVKMIRVKEAKEESVTDSVEVTNEISVNTGKFSDAGVGDTITFGRYEQDNNTSNGKEEIEWRVLAKEGNKILVISEKAIDCQQYNTEYTEVTWETCTLRKWLNETFFKEAFSADEQKMIPETKVTADANPSYSTSPGNDTTDRVFLLSITEAEKYFGSNDDRMCVPTKHAIENGAWTSISYKKDGEATCWWWLRSPGYDSYDTANVDDVGYIYYSGGSVDNSDGCARPALWIET